MTEIEARTKWCPMIRVTVTPVTGGWENNMLTNRGDIPASNTDTLCIASKCMMWLPANGFRRTGEQGHCGLINSI